MSKSPTRRRPRRTRRTADDRRQAVDVVTQLETAARHPHAAVLGAVLGGAVPWFARVISHKEIPATWGSGSRLAVVAMVAVVLGCCAFSMLTVFRFGLAAFDDGGKAAGFVLALEGVMLVSRGSASAYALALLVLINAVANGCVIALARDRAVRRSEADQRRRETRARNRDRARSAPASIATTTTRAPDPVVSSTPEVGTQVLVYSQPPAQARRARQARLVLS